jgi:ATP-dependent DNA ligase
MVTTCDVLKRWELTRSVMGTKGYNPDTPKAHLIVFDIQHHGEESCLNKDYLERKSLIKQLIKPDAPMGPESFKVKQGTWLATAKYYNIGYLDVLWDKLVMKSNGEGLMLKFAGVAKYGKDWTKVKKEYTVDCFIIGATNGKGKYEGQIGALELAVMNGDVIWPIGKCSGMTDSERKDMTDLALEGKLKGRVCEVKFNEVTKNKKLRHPRFMRWRDDKAREACLLEQL